MARSAWRPGSLPGNTYPLEIGRRPDGARYWHGRIDEVAIYDQALGAAQIAGHHTARRGTL